MASNDRNIAASASRNLIAIRPAGPGQEREPPRPGSTTSKKRKASLACTACQKRKSRCGGGEPPCGQCEKHNTECRFEVELDQRRKGVSRKRLDEYERSDRLLENLLTAIQSPDSAKVQGLVSFIQTNASRDEIGEYVNSSFAGIQDKGSMPKEASYWLPRSSERSPDSNRRRVLSMNELADVPLFRLSAFPWTTVTDDDGLVSQWVSLFFTWSYPFSRFIDQDIFLEAMGSGDVTSPFCSPFLVNALLSFASHFSNTPTVNVSPFDTNLSLKFYEEARKLWAVENGKVSMTNFQGLMLSVMDSMFRGDREYSLIMWAELEGMYDVMGFSRFKEPPLSLVGIELAKMTELWKYVGWNTWALCTISSAHSTRPNKITRPALSMTALNVDSPRRDDWFPYPSQRRPQKVETDWIFFQRCQVTRIIENALLKVTPVPPLSSIVSAEEKFCDSMETWREDLPEELLPNILTQPVLDLHLIYYIGYVAVCERFRVLRTEASKGKGLLHPHGHLSRSSSTSSGESFDASVLPRACDKVVEVVPLLREFRRQYGLTRLSSVALQATCNFTEVILPVLDHPRYHDALGELCMFVVYGAQHAMFCREIALNIKPTAIKMGVELPPTIMKMLSDFERDEWKPSDYRRLSVLYPTSSGERLPISDEGEQISTSEAE